MCDVIVTTPTWGTISQLVNFLLFLRFIALAIVVKFEKNNLKFKRVQTQSQLLLDCKNVVGQMSPTHRV